MNMNKALRGALEAERLTLRDQFAMAALTGHLSNPHCSDAADDHVARWAYQMADAMLEARKAERDE